MQHKPLRLLLIGPLPPPLGGATVLFKSLVDSLGKREDVEIIVVSTSDRADRLFVRVRRVLRTFYNVIRYLGRVDVISLHLSTTGLPLVGSVAAGLTRLWKQPLIIHKFGGSDYHRYRLLRRRLAKRALQNAGIYLAETKELVKLAHKDRIFQAKWFPNSRPAEDIPEVASRSNACRRFVYLGHVRPRKGIRYMIEAAERFSEDITVDVYGPFMEGLSEEMFAGLKRVNYKGVVEPQNVISTLLRYDAMLMPTCFATEGYPGTIIEAYFAGMPVICSRIGALPEIADDSCAVLIEPKNSDELYKAMKKLAEDEQLWRRLCEGAIAKRDFFNMERRVDEFVGYCRELAAGVSFKSGQGAELNISD